MLILKLQCDNGQSCHTDPIMGVMVSAQDDGLAQDDNHLLARNIVLAATLCQVLSSMGLFHCLKESVSSWAPFALNSAQSNTGIIEYLCTKPWQGTHSSSATNTLKL